MFGLYKVGFHIQTGNWDRIYVDGWKTLSGWRRYTMIQDTHARYNAALLPQRYNNVDNIDWGDSREKIR